MADVSETLLSPTRPLTEITEEEELAENKIIFNEATRNENTKELKWNTIDSKNNKIINEATHEERLKLIDNIQPSILNYNKDIPDDKIIIDKVTLKYTLNYMCNPEAVKLVFPEVSAAAIQNVGHNNVLHGPERDNIAAFYGNIEEYIKKYGIPPPPVASEKPPIKYPKVLDIKSELSTKIRKEEENKQNSNNYGSNTSNKVDDNYYPYDIYPNASDARIETKEKKGKQKGGEFLKTIANNKIIFQYITIGNDQIKRTPPSQNLIEQKIGLNILDEPQKQFKQYELILTDKQKEIIHQIEKKNPYNNYYLFAYLVYLIINNKSPELYDLSFIEYIGEQLGTLNGKKTNTEAEQTLYEQLNETIENALNDNLLENEVNKKQKLDELIEILNRKLSAKFDKNNLTKFNSGEKIPYNDQKSIIDTFMFIIEPLTPQPDKSKYLEFEINGKIGYEVPNPDSEMPDDIKRTTVITFDIEKIIFRKYQNGEFNTYKYGDKLEEDSIISTANAYSRPITDEENNCVFLFNNEINDFAEKLFRIGFVLNGETTMEEINANIKKIYEPETNIINATKFKENTKYAAMVKKYFEVGNINKDKINREFAKLTKDILDAQKLHNDINPANLFQYRNRMKTIKMDIDLLLLRMQVFNIIMATNAKYQQQQRQLQQREKYGIKGGGGGGGKLVLPLPKRNITRRFKKKHTRKQT